MNRGTNFSLDDIGRTEDRVVRIVNLHYKADCGDVQDFFGESFTINDFIRAVNLRTSKNTVDYVLFATEQERINVQDMSGRRILDHEVKVLPAQSGFRVSLFGDKLLPPLMDKYTQASCNDEVHDGVPPAIGDIEAFPSLSAAATSRLATRRTSLLPAKKQSAQQRALQNRLIFLNNVGQGPEVNETSFRLYFGRYVVVDVKRPLDPRTNSPHPTAFVMLTSVADRDAALNRLKGVPMQSRKVTMEVPKMLQKVDEQCFLPTSGENVFIFSTFPREPVVNSTSLDSLFSSYCGFEGYQTTAFTAPPTIEDDNTNELYRLLGQLGMTDSGSRQQSLEDLVSDDGRRAKNAEVVWGMCREQLRAAQTL